MEDFEINKTQVKENSFEKKKIRMRKKTRLEILNELSSISPSSFVEFISVLPVERFWPSISYTDLNIKQKVCYDLVKKSIKDNSQLLLIVQGAAGSGKSFIIHSLRSLFKENKIKYKVYSFTGSSAFAVGGSTFHRGFSLHRAFRKRKAEVGNSYPKWKFLTTKYIIFDELSLIGLSLLGYIDTRLKSIFDNDKPFGGLSVILLGDIAQLCPIGDKMIYQPAGESKHQSEGEQAYKNFKNCILLDESMRQKDSLLFYELLSRIRVGEIIKSDVEILNSRYIKNLNADEILEFTDHPILFSTNQKCQAYNNIKLKQLEEAGAKIIEIKAVDSLKLPAGCENILRLCVGARVMLTKNLYTDAGLYNGNCGKIISISEELNSLDQPSHIFIKFDQYYGERYDEEREEVPISPTEYEFTDDFSKVTFTRTQYNLTLAYGLTIHKSQGATLKKVSINLPKESETCQMFSRNTPCLLYTALSRVRKLEDILLTQPFSSVLVHNQGASLRAWKEEEKRLKSFECKN